MPRFTLIATCTAAALSATGAFANGYTASAGDARMENGSLVVEGVTAKAPGYIVVTETLPEDAPGTVPVGFTEVRSGRNENIVIEGDFSHGGDYVIMLYEESGEAEGFQWREGRADLPAVVDGDRVTTTFNMMVEDGQTDG